MYKITGQNNYQVYIKKQLDEIIQGRFEFNISDSFDFNGLFNEIHITHHKNQPTKSKVINISHTKYNRNIIKIPPKVKEIETDLNYDTYILFGDFDKNSELCLDIAEKFPEKKFKAVTQYDFVGEYQNILFVKKDQDLNKIVDGCKLILCLSKMDETYGFLPLEMASSGLPIIVSKNYKSEFIEKFEINSNNISKFIDSDLSKFIQIDNYNKYKDYQYKKIKKLILKLYKNNERTKHYNRNHC